MSVSFCPYTKLASLFSSFISNKTNNYKVGMNSLSNRLWFLNGKIQLDWLGQSFDSFKIKCKGLLLA